MDYRREIDGLRALAVLPVILFHAGFEKFSGGFVGVDVFFVISGYLITTIIIAELEQGKFSIVNFYERRARRILPALFLVMFVCIPFAWFWLLPSDMKDFSKSLVAVSVFASNILFWRESGYFATEAELKPLLHTWSLAVEEQYYFIFPLFLMLFWKLGRRWILVTLALVFFTSLALAEWGSHNKQSAAFYLLPTRVWELLIGAFAAFYLLQANRKDFGKVLSEVAGWLGVALIMYAVFDFSKATPFPGFYALVPTIGTVMVILFATQQTTVGKFVGNKAFVGVGLISYNAYLWHQPLFSFARHRSLADPSNTVFLLLSLLSLILAYISWRFVEVYFRRKYNVTRNSIFFFAIISIILFVSFGIVGQKKNGFIDSIRWDEIRKIEEVKDQKASGFLLCEANKVKNNFKTGLVCVIGDSSVSPSGILWGDSYAGSAVFGIDHYLKKVKKSYYAVLSDGCPPLPGISRRNNAFNCFDGRHQDVLNAFNANDKLIELVWVGKFRDVAGPSPIEDIFIDNKTPTLSVVETKFIDAIEALNNNNKRVVIVLEGPNFEQSIPHFLSKSYLLGSKPSTSILETGVTKQRLEIGLLPQFFNQFENVTYVDGIELFCRNTKCNAILESGSPLVVDGGHISHEASEILALKVFEAFDRLRLR